MIGHQFRRSDGDMGVDLPYAIVKLLFFNDRIIAFRIEAEAEHQQIGSPRFGILPDCP